MSVLMLFAKDVSIIRTLAWKISLAVGCVGDVHPPALNPLVDVNGGI